MVGSWRYLGGAVGFGFGVLWMTVGLGAAIVSVLCAGLGFGAVFIAERGRANGGAHPQADETARAEDPSQLLDDLAPEYLPHDELPDDEAYPLARDDWPLPALGRRASRPAEVGSAAPDGP